MAKDLRGFKNGKKSGFSEKETDEIYQKADKDSVKNAENMYKKYSGKSQEELQSELFKLVSKNKQSGQLNEKQIENFTSQVSPLLDPNQKQKLNEIINMIKKQ